MVKNVLITGGNSGIGDAIKKKFEEKSYNVFIVGKKNLKKKNYYKINLENLIEVKKFTKEIQKIKIDILINNAGASTVDNAFNFNLKKMSKIHNINFYSAVIISKSVLKNMINKKWGRIVNITSIFAEYAREDRLSYISSKFLLNSLTKSLAADFSKKNILCNSVAPGVTNTRLTNKMLNNSYLKKKLLKKIPMKRFAKTNEIAELVFHLGSNENKFITGQQIFIDGGFSII
tara:strand:+ start:1593 stop:2288 length:696 start_codon:yes stop_codon:yes gene_type:complete